MELRPDDLAVVTGAGSGIGLAVARALAARGCRLALVDVRPDRLESARALLPNASIHAADVADARAVRELAQSIQRAQGALALLVNSAGISVAGPFLATPPDDFERALRVNFDGTVSCCRAFLPAMLAAGRGHVVALGSCFGWVGYPGKTAYSASKAAVRAFSEALRVELRGTGVGVTVAYPGPVDTNLVRDGLVRDGRARDGPATDASAQRDEVAFLARRGLAPERVAQRILRAVERDSPRVVVGRAYRLLDLLARLVPGWAPSIAARFGPRWRGAADGD